MSRFWFDQMKLLRKNMRLTNVWEQLDMTAHKLVNSGLNVKTWSLDTYLLPSTHTLQLSTSQTG